MRGSCMGKADLGGLSSLVGSQGGRLGRMTQFMCDGELTMDGTGSEL